MKSVIKETRTNVLRTIVEPSFDEAKLRTLIEPTDDGGVKGVEGSDERVA